MTIPAIPNAGTADTNPLVTFEQYQFVTNDQGSTSSNFELALDDALDMLQREMRRTFLYAQYTERLFIYLKSGQVYPTATPLDASKGVSTPTGDPPENVGIFQGNGIWIGWYQPLPSLPMFAGVVPPQTDITYWGGWTQSTLPAKLRRIICKVCWFILNPVALVGMAGGVKSVSVGGVSISGDLSSFIDCDPQLGRDIRSYRRPQVRAFDAQVTS